MEGTEFVTQLAQFSSVEQQITQSSKLDLISLQLRGLASNEAAGLVGKTVTVKGDDKIAFDGNNIEGSTTELTKATDDVTVTVRDENGEVVSTKTYDHLEAGPLPANFWDGKVKGGAAAAAGEYSISVTSADGKEVPVNREVTAVVTKVTFEKGYPELVLDNGMTVAVSDLISVGGTVPGGTPIGGAGSGSGSGSGAGSASNLATNPALSSSVLQQIKDLLSPPGS